MTNEVDAEFYNRADAIIHLANNHLEHIEAGKASASLMYATARFNAWVSALGFPNGTEMECHRHETIEYFVKQYRAMLEDNLDDYIRKFSEYMSPESDAEKSQNS